MHFFFNSKRQPCYLLPINTVVPSLHDVGPHATNLPLTHHVRNSPYWRLACKLQFRSSTRPTSLLQNSNFSLGRGLVIISDVLLSVWIFLTTNDFISIASRIHWYLTSMYFDREWKVRCLLRCIALWLWQCNTKFSSTRPSSYKNFFIHNSYLPSLVRAIYSAFVVDNATYFCSLDCHETAPPVNFIKYPDVDFLELISPAIFASVYQSNTCLLPKHNMKLEVPLRYLSIYFTANQCFLPWFERNRLTTPIA